ncbi:hypothetical protein WH47_10094 [Habropoda laboriosa]|uniref:Uncharacterized protein n=1 Tax=Habropoda laboriosa TaxID=597456 RepID=A0A0L7R3V9_9HYME|nr:hypothetical protein WH47_10094 [Habropoda laboriosa]
MELNMELGHVTWPNRKLKVSARIVKAEAMLDVICGGGEVALNEQNLRSRL